MKGKGVFDPPCARYDVAIKALFLLWRRGKWPMLLELFPTLTREEVNKRFQAFDDTIDSKIRTEKQVFTLVVMFPEVVQAGRHLSGGCSHQSVYGAQRTGVCGWKWQIAQSTLRINVFKRSIRGMLGRLDKAEYRRGDTQ